jgi:hypothetical protein
MNRKQRAKKWSSRLFYLAQAAAEPVINISTGGTGPQQATTIRTMLREGIERCGYAGALSRFIPFRRKARRLKTPLLAKSR